MTAGAIAADDKDALVAAVDARYQAMQPWSWDAPDWDEPAQWAYSRVTDSERFAVLGQRVQAWCDELAVHGVLVEDITPPDRPAWRFGRQLRLASPRPGTGPLFVRVSPVEKDVDTVGGVLVAFAEPEAEVARVPDCTCDACDRGSQALLWCIDSSFLAAVAGAIEVESTGAALLVRVGESSHSTSPSAEVPRGRWVGGSWW